MRIKQIYITKEGEPTANPEMEYPTEPIEDDDGELILNDSCPNCHTEYDAIDAEYQICHLCKFDSSHEAELQRYHSGLLPFEDKKDALDFIPWEYHGYNGTILSQHWNTLIPVELEVEVVEQRSFIRANSSDFHWEHFDGHKTSVGIYQYRKVLRIKP